MTDNIHDLKTAEADAALEAIDPRVAECEARARAIIDPLADRLTAAAVYVPGTIQHIAQRLYDEPEVTDERVIADITAAVEGIEKTKAEALAAEEKAEAAAKVEARRQELLATATIVFPAVFAAADMEEAADDIVDRAIDYAWRLIDLTAGDPTGAAE